MHLQPRPDHSPHALDLGIPLYANTDRVTHVAQIVGRLLEDIST